MRDLIKKILREDMDISPDVPHGDKTFNELPREDRVSQIEKNKKDIERILPRVVEFFKEKFGDDLFKLKVEEKGVRYGNENYSTKKIILEFYFSEFFSEDWKTKREIYRDLKSFFNVDVYIYGVPLGFEVYKMTWKKI
jgi:hypothetical protein